MSRHSTEVERDDEGRVVVALVCTKCKGKHQPVSAFHRALPGRNSAKHGYRMPCKSCQRKKRAAQQKKYRGRHLEKQKVMIDAWRKAHPTYERDRSKRRYASDPKYKVGVRTAAKAWTQAHPEYARAAAKLRRARLKGAVGIFTADDARELFEEYAGKCVYCTEPATTIDHVVPLCDGGSHSKDNLVPACKTCNSKKGRKPLLVFLATRTPKEAA